MRAVQGYRMGNPGQVLMSDGQWALDVFLPHRPHATNYLDQGQYRMSRVESQWEQRTEVAT